MTLEELESGLDEISRSPSERGTLELIVRRPAIDRRETVAEGQLTLAKGLEGDTWAVREAPGMSGGSPHPDKQITLMNSRVASLLAGDRERWPLAGDQLFVDLDLSAENLPPGTQLAIGSAVLEATAQPHTGCQKFGARFGLEALKFINSPSGRRLRLRGIYAKVVQPGVIRPGDPVKKLQ